MSNAKTPQELMREIWSQSPLKPPTLRLTAEDDAANAVRFREFRRLWSQYQSALAVDTFAMTKEEREQNQSEVERCFEALNRLAKETL